MATPDLAVQNWFETTLSSGISASDTTIPLNAVPTGVEGYLIIEPDSSTNREVIYFTSKTSNSVLLPSALLGRGIDGSTAQSHNSGATVRMQITSSYWKALQDGTALAANSIPTTAIQAGAVTTPKLQPTVIESAFTVQGTRFTTASTSYIDVPGCSMSYTAGSTNEKLILTMTVMAMGSAGNASSCRLNIDGTDVGQETYHQEAAFSRQAANIIYDISANDTVTIKVRCKSGTGASVSVTNDSAIWIPKVTGFAIYR